MRLRLNNHALDGKFPRVSTRARSLGNRHLHVAAVAARRRDRGKMLGDHTWLGLGIMQWPSLRHGPPKMGMCPTLLFGYRIANASV